MLRAAVRAGRHRRDGDGATIRPLGRQGVRAARLLLHAARARHRARALHPPPHARYAPGTRARLPLLSILAMLGSIGATRVQLDPLNNSISFINLFCPFLFHSTSAKEET